MGYVLLGLGLVLLIEGLVYALAPSLVEQLLTLLRELPEDARRRVGLISMAAGLLLLWLAHLTGVLG